jgi:hypothetical protein
MTCTGLDHCCVCGKYTAGNLTDQELPRWICLGPCSVLWQEANERNERGEYLPTNPLDRVYEIGPEE